MTPWQHGRARTVLLALIAAMAVMWLTGAIPRWGQWYSDQPFYRAQVHAFLEGRLALSHDPEGVTHDLAWIDGGVQQVWGLGVPAWLAFWEIAATPFGLTPFPDRVAMGIGVALVMYLLLRVWLGSTGDRTAASRGAFLLCAIVPGVLAMMRGRIAVYEEASAYAYGSAMILLVGTIVMLRRPTTARYLLLVGFAGLTGLVRPTVWFYGAGTAGIATLLYIQYRGSIRAAVRVVAVAAALFMAGGGVLYATNYLRFGSGGEFGHRLNLEDLPGNLYATRFDHPFETIPASEAVKELVGGLFGSPEKRARTGHFFYDKKLHKLQSPTPRWREYYFSNYSWVHAPILLLGIGLCAFSWVRVRRRAKPVEGPGPAADRVIEGPALERESRWLGVWALIAMLPLLAFYTRSPSVSSRYFLDLAPAFVVLMVIVWRHLASWLSGRSLGSFVTGAHLATAALVGLAIWLSYSSIYGTTRRQWVSTLRAKQGEMTALKRSEPTHSPRLIPAAYDLEDPWVALYIGGDQLNCRCHVDAYGEGVCNHLGYQDPDLKQFVNEVEIDALVVKRIDHVRPRRCVAGGPWPFACTVENPEAVLPDPRPADPSAHVEVRWSGGALYRNGTDWDLHTGAIGVATYFWVDDPQYLELEVSPQDPRLLTPDWRPQVRAKVQLEELAIERMSSTARGVRIRFKGPTKAKYRAGLQIVFLAFGPPDKLDEPMSDYKLWRVAWRDR